MIGPAHLPPLSRPADPRASDRAADAGAERPQKPRLAGPPLGENEIEPMPGSVTFGEFLSALNPLHHIPGVSWVYRKLTGETIQPVFRVLGGLVTGGPIGAIAAAVGALAEELLTTTDLSATPAQAVAAVGADAPLETRSLADMTTTAGTPLQPLPVATRLAARAYPAPALPLRDAAPPPDPAAGAVAAAVSLPAPARAATPDAAAGEETAGVVGPAPAGPAPAGPGQPGRIRRAPVVPITSGGQDPAFVQRMMQGLEAYERVMRARTGPALPQASPAP
jgi:hypothetical protein